MSASYIPPFPNDNASEDTPYTQVFEKARINRNSSGTPEHVLANPRTPMHPSGTPEHVLANPRTPTHPRHREPEPPRVAASPLHQSNLPGGRSPYHHQGSSGNGTRGGSGRSGSQHKPVNHYASHPSPNPYPSKSNGSGRKNEGQIGNSTPARNTPIRKPKKPAEQAYDDLLPPFPTDGTETNYTEVFQRYKKGSTSPSAPPVPSYTPRDVSPKLQRCRCFGL